MTPFELEEPGSLAEALELLDPEDPAVRPIAGGTALMLMMKSGLYRPQRLVSLRKIAPDLAEIRSGPDGVLEIGAMVRLSELQRSAVIRTSAPLIGETLLNHSNVRVRNVATIGGNLAHADPHMDLPPTLIALDARVRAASSAGEREIAVDALDQCFHVGGLAPRPGDLESEHMALVKSRRHPAQFLEAAQQQTRATKQDEGHCHLRYN